MSAISKVILIDRKKPIFSILKLKNITFFTIQNDSGKNQVISQLHQLFFLTTQSNLESSDFFIREEQKK